MKCTSSSTLIIGLAFASALSAQCVARNPGGNKININRPRDADVGSTGFSPVTPLNKTLPDWLCFGISSEIDLQP